MCSAVACKHGFFFSDFVAGLVLPRQYASEVSKVRGCVGIGGTVVGGDAIWNCGWYHYWRVVGAVHGHLNKHILRGRAECNNVPDQGEENSHH